MKRFFFFLELCLVFSFLSCGESEELSREDLGALSPAGLNEILAKTVSKPWRGEDFVPGKLGGTWNSSITEDPKSFNLLVAERDANTAAIVGRLHDYLVEYDVIKREWKPNIASFEILVDDEEGTLDLVYTLRDDLYWSFYDSQAQQRRERVTSDDVVFWYDEIVGDPAFQSSGYNGQFLTLEDGTEAHVDIKKLDDRRFAFHFPRITANPLLSTNMDFGPRFIYQEAKRQGGVQGVLDLFSVAADPKTIPSMGPWFLTEYSPGQRLVYKRNPDYWRKDANGVSIPYYEEIILQILPDTNTQFLLFKEGKLEAYPPRPEDLDEVVNKANADYTVFNAEGSLGAMLWSFNQNPVIRDSPQYEWFTQKEFRQAMSRLLNRDRIVAQVYRGLAQPKLDFFPEPNPYYNPDITLKYLYDPEEAVRLLSSIGFSRDSGGVMRDGKNRAVEFDLEISSDVTTTSDTASIIMDEAAKVGIKINIRTLDFQKIVEQLTGTYDWSSLIIGLGTALFPTQGSNVWPSTGNLHLWYPLQEKPATEWEARIDYLYNEGSYTIDEEKARLIWDEYQRIILEQCPVIYLSRSRSFYALRNRWDFTNLYFDNLNSLENSHVYLKQ
jgi:peptide/nickel transport system substrate-binding protein